MTAKELYCICKDSECDGRLRMMQANSALKEYHKCHCYHPIKLKVFDSHLGHFVVRKVPCGKCYHCVETRINEWVTRMYAHLEDFKYVYFVTLTYRSFTCEELQDPYNKYVFDYLHGAAWFEDADNSTKHFCFTPCLLCKEHHQNFMKRLRRATGNVGMTFFMSGEYGKKYAHPHYHYIIFSHQPIRTLDFVKAWGAYISRFSDGVGCSRNSSKKVFKSFGRIQVDDLVTNGTISDKSLTVDGQKMSAKSCFAYVAKYIGKKSNNTRRLSIVYNKLNDGKFYETENSPLPYKTFTEFCNAFRPFVCCSRGTPIGSLFFERHAASMAQGVFARPPLQTEGAYIVPKYFRRKAQEYLYSLRLISPNSSLVKGNLPDVAKSLASYVKEDLSRCVTALFDKTSEHITHFVAFTPERIERDLQRLLTSRDCFVDVRTRSRFLLHFDYSHIWSLSMHEYTFDKSSRSWTLVKKHNFERWCLDYLLSMPDCFKEYMKGYNKSKEDEIYFDKVQDWYLERDKFEDFYDSVPILEKENENFFNLKDATHLQFTNI